MNDTNPAAWTTDTITAVNSFEGTVRMRLHHPFLCTESDLEAARRYLCDFIEKMESGRNEELNRRLAEAVDRHERLQAGYAQMARQQEHDAREKLRLFDYAGQLKPLAEALIESALDSDAAGRPEGALADNALALRAALAKNPNPSGHATGCGNSDNAADSILTSEGGRTKAGASDAVGTESTPARSSSDPLIKAVRALVFAARTSGGTAGRDETLCAALDVVESLLPPMSGIDASDGELLGVGNPPPLYPSLAAYQRGDYRDAPDSPLPPGATS